MKIILSLILAGSLVACGSSTCSRASKCSADPAPTQAQIDDCEANKKAETKCTAEAQAVADCYYKSVTCGSDNKTDAVATATKATADCKSQQDAYTKCKG